MPERCFICLYSRRGRTAPCIGCRGGSRFLSMPAFKKRRRPLSQRPASPPAGELRYVVVDDEGLDDIEF